MKWKRIKETLRLVFWDFGDKKEDLYIVPLEKLTAEIAIESKGKSTLIRAFEEVISLKIAVKVLEDRMYILEKMLIKEKKKTRKIKE